MSPGSSLFRQLRYDGILVFHDSLKRGGDGRRHGEGRPNVAEREVAARDCPARAGWVGECDASDFAFDVIDRRRQHFCDGISGGWPDAPEKKILPTERR